MGLRRRSAVRTSSGVSDGGIGHLSSAPFSFHLRRGDPVGHAVEPGKRVADAIGRGERPGERLGHRVVGDVAPAAGIGVERPPERRAVLPVDGLEVASRLHWFHLDRALRAPGG